VSDLFDSAGRQRTNGKRPFEPKWKQHAKNASKESPMLEVGKCYYIIAHAYRPGVKVSIGRSGSG